MRFSHLIAVLKKAVTPSCTVLPRWSVRRRISSVSSRKETHSLAVWKAVRPAQF